MVAVNRGKDFENQVKDGFISVSDTSVIRLIDPQNGYAGVRNVCDFIVYHKPFQYLIECKSVHGNTMSIHSNNPTRCYGMITNNQWDGMLKHSYIDGVIAGVVVWFVDREVTYFLSIQLLDKLRSKGYKSIAWDAWTWFEDIDDEFWCLIPGKQRRVLFDYDMTKLFAKADRYYGGEDNAK